MTAISPTPAMLRALAERLGIYEIVYGEREPDMCNRPAMEIVRVNGKAHRLDWLLTWEGAGAVLEHFPDAVDVGRDKRISGGKWYCQFNGREPTRPRAWAWHILSAENGPTAVILAACRALGVE